MPGQPQKRKISNQCKENRRTSSSSSCCRTNSSSDNESRNVPARKRFFTRREAARDDHEKNLQSSSQQDRRTQEESEAAEAAAARDDCSSSEPNSATDNNNNNNNNADLTEEQKRADRARRNRASALRSRNKRRQRLAFLEVEYQKLLLAIGDLHSENASLKAENARLKRGRHGSVIIAPTTATATTTTMTKEKKSAAAAAAKAAISVEEASKRLRVLPPPLGLSQLNRMSVLDDIFPKGHKNLSGQRSSQSYQHKQQQQQQQQQSFATSTVPIPLVETRSILTPRGVDDDFSDQFVSGSLTPRLFAKAPVSSASRAHDGCTKTELDPWAEVDKMALFEDDATPLSWASSPSRVIGSDNNNSKNNKNNNNEEDNADAAAQAVASSLKLLPAVRMCRSPRLPLGLRRASSSSSLGRLVST